MLCNVIRDHLDNCDMIWWGGNWGKACLHEVNTNSSTYDSLIDQLMINKF